MPRDVLYSRGRPVAVVLAAALVVLAARIACGQPVRAEKAAPELPILNENAYWRILYRMGFLRLSAKALKAEGETLLSKRDLARLEKQTKVLLSQRGIDWSRTDWRDVACVFWGGGQGGQFTPEAAAFRPVTVVPDNWAAADFDDQSWMTRNFISIPMQLLRRYYKVETSYQHIHGICLRGYFEVADPAATGGLVLRLTYRGGARVLLNGREIARKHLPAGKLAPDAQGQEYPKSAYLTRDGKDFIGDHLYINRASYPPEELKRVAALRDRAIGPVTIPARTLRKGRNVLAIELRSSPYHPIILPGAGNIEKPRTEKWFRNWHRNGRNLPTWEHAKLVKLDLRAPKGNVPSALSRPETPRLWADDMHRRFYSPDFHPRGMPAGVIRIVGVRNGSFSAQLGLATGAKPLRGLRVIPAALKRAGGPAVIPASAIEVSYLLGYSHHLDGLILLGGAKGRGGSNTMSAQVAMVARHYAPYGVNRKTIAYFDHLHSDPPQAVNARSIQPIWVRVQVPADAPPGLYKGSVTVSADGLAATSMPMEVEVIDWRLPDPLAFRTHVQSEQSPYGVARHYKTPLWSNEHFKRMEASFRQLGRLGNDYLFIPVIHNTEFGNRRDSPIKWIREPGGRLRFDYTSMDRYLDLAGKHLGKPRVICFVIMMMGGERTPPVEVGILDPATGREEIVNVGPAVSGFVRRAKGTAAPDEAAVDARRFALWGPFAKSLCAHMKSKGLFESMYWGYKWDIPDDRRLMQFMAEAAPGVHWASGGHNASLDKYFHAVSRVYGTNVSGRSKLGWKTPFGSHTVNYGLALQETLKEEQLPDEQKRNGKGFLNLLMPRCLGSVITVDGSSGPFSYRAMTDRALHAGFGGIARMGADYFDYTWFAGCRNTDYLGVGRSCMVTLWPGKNGAESSARNEAMLEGIQEAEARIFLERAIDRSAVSKQRAEEVRTLLARHMASTVYLGVIDVAVDHADYAVGWQERSRKLFRAAADVARQTAHAQRRDPPPGHEAEP